MTTVNVDYWQPTGRLMAQAGRLFSKGGSHRWLVFHLYEIGQYRTVRYPEEYLCTAAEWTDYTSGG